MLLFNLNVPQYSPTKNQPNIKQWSDFFFKESLWFTTTAVQKANIYPVTGRKSPKIMGAHRFAEESCGDVPALFVLRVAAASTSVDGHTRRFIENVGGGPELPAHVHTHLPGDALSLPPLGLDTCRRHDRRPNAALVDKTSSATSRRDNSDKHSQRFNLFFFFRSGDFFAATK